MIGQRLLQLTKDTFVYGLGSAMTGLIGLVLVPLLTRSVSPGQYGILDLLTTIIFLVSVVVGLGFDSALGILFFKDQDTSRQQRLLASALWTVTFLASTVSLLGYTMLPWLTHIIIGPGASSTPIAIALAILPVTLFQGYLLSCLRLKFRAAAYLISIATYVMSIIIFSLWLVTVKHLGISGYLLSWLFASVLTSLVALMSLGGIRPSDIRLTSMRELLRIGWPLIPAGLAGWSLSLIDRFFIKHYSLTDLGYYALAVKIASILGLVTAALQLAWGPFAMSIAKEPEAKATYSRVATLYFAMTGIIAILLTAFTPRLIQILSGTAYSAASPAIAPLLFGAIAYGSYYIFAIGSNISEKTSHISWTTMAAAVINVSLNFVLIPRWGIVGASIATGISYAISAALIAAISQRNFFIPYDFKRIGFIFTGTTVGIFLITISQTPILVGGTILGVYTSILLLTGTIKLDTLRSVLQGHAI